MRWFSAVVAIAVSIAVASPAVAAERRAVTYRPPVDGPITDPFRPPETPYGAGNRGVDYATKPGEAVRAAAGGEVVFAGPVGNSLHVVVLHADGIRTSYSFLRSAAVTRGNRVATGAAVGTTNASLHFGARAGEAYIDPAVLLAGDGRVHLIPDGTAAMVAAARRQSESAERAGLVRVVWGGAAQLASASATVARAGGRVAIAVADHAPSPLPFASVGQVRRALAGLDDLVVHGQRPAIPGESAIRSAIDAADAMFSPAPCTPQDTPVPDVRRPRHIAVLVAGLGSSSDRAAVYEVNTIALGYAPADVKRFSYRGGTTADRPYERVDTLADLRRSGRRLRELLERTQYENPGVPVDIIAHSQGGLVARSALGDELDPFDPRSPRIDRLITLGSPHNGANLATAAAWLRHTPRGQAITRGVGVLGRRRGIDPRAKSIRQMAETSDFLRSLNRRPLPKSVRAVSIAARRDVVVPSPRSRLRGADNVVVTLPGIGNDHSRLPGSAPAHREMALALAGAPPTCRRRSDIAADLVTGQAIDKAEKAAAIGAVAASGGGP